MITIMFFLSYVIYKVFFDRIAPFDDVEWYGDLDFD